MTSNEFFRRWSTRIDAVHREQFIVELAGLVTFEQARERRRLCTDTGLYRKACEETTADLAQHGHLAPALEWKATA
jgi:hypothetical protein